MRNAVGPRWNTPAVRLGRDPCCELSPQADHRRLDQLKRDRRAEHGQRRYASEHAEEIGPRGRHIVDAERIGGAADQLDHGEMPKIGAVADLADVPNRAIDEKTTDA